MVRPGQPRTLAALNKVHIVHVAESLYNTQLDGKAKIDLLREQLQAVMEGSLACDNVACAGGPCNTGVHVFTVAQYTPGEGGDMERLLQTTQNDDDAFTPGSTPPPNRVNPLPRADGAEQQKQLALEALQRAGFSAADIWPGGATPAPASNRLGTGSALRNLANMFSRSGSTPRPEITVGQGGSGAASPLQPPGPTHRGGRQPPTERVQGLPPPAGFPPATEPPAENSALDTMMKIVEKQLEQSAAQSKSQEALANKITDLLEKKLGGGDNDGEHSAGPTKGRVCMVPPNNPAALALTGVTVGPRWAMNGDLSTVDMNHVRKYIKSGRNGHSVQDARTAELWPNQYLPAKPGSKDGVDYDELTFVQWIIGFITKIFAEVDDSRNGSVEHNQLRMLMKLCRLVQIYDWEDVRLIGAELFLGLERGALTWSDWQPMEIWWAQQIDFLRDRVVVRQTRKRPLPAGPAGPKSAAPPPGQPPAKSQKRNKDINGVPPDTLKSHHICIKWNVGTCSVQAAHHDSPDRSDSQQVRHICGGCWFLSQVEDESHSMRTCKRKNSSGVFQ